MAGSAAKPEPKDHDPSQDAPAPGDVAACPTFDEMGLDAALLRGIHSYGFEEPSAIQKLVIPPLVKGRHIIAQAPPGTGKTGAFAIGLLQRIEWSRRELQAMVLCPTRELATQCEQVISSIGQDLCDGSFSHAFVGGTRVADTFGKMACSIREAVGLGGPLVRKTWVLVAVGTPGRVYDVVKRGDIRPGSLKLVVFDEADELFSQGFSEQIYEFFKFFPNDVQVFLCSATMPPEVLELTTKYMRDPIRVVVKQKASTREGIQQFYVEIEEEFKLESLTDLYDMVSISHSVVFCNTRRKVDWLAEKMQAKDFSVSFIHTEMPRDDRKKVMATFLSGSSRVLISTDFAFRARGSETVTHTGSETVATVETVTTGDLLARVYEHHPSLVINFDLPANKENYHYRIQNSRRYDRKGVAINFVTSRDMPTLKELQEQYTIEELPMDFTLSDE